MILSIAARTSADAQFMFDTLSSQFSCAEAVALNPNRAAARQVEARRNFMRNPYFFVRGEYRTQEWRREHGVIVPMSPAYDSLLPDGRHLFERS